MEPSKVEAVDLQLDRRPWSCGSRSATGTARSTADRWLLLEADPPRHTGGHARATLPGRIKASAVLKASVPCGLQKTLGEVGVRCKTSAMFADRPGAARHASAPDRPSSSDQPTGADVRRRPRPAWPCRRGSLLTIGLVPRRRPCSGSARPTPSRAAVTTVRLSQPAGAKGSPHRERFGIDRWSISCRTMISCQWRKLDVLPLVEIIRGSNSYMENCIPSALADSSDDSPIDRLLEHIYQRISLTGVLSTRFILCVSIDTGS